MKRNIVSLAILLLIAALVPVAILLRQQDQPVQAQAAETASIDEQIPTPSPHFHNDLPIPANPQPIPFLENQPDRLQTQAAATVFHPKVLAIFVNPKEGARSLSGVYDNLDGDTLRAAEDRLLGTNIDYYRGLTEGVVNYEISGKQYIDTFSPNDNGFRFTIDNFAPCAGGNKQISDGRIATTCEQQKWQVNYDRFIDSNNVCEAAQAANADEIWLFSKGFVMTWESSMMSPGEGFWVNGPVHAAPRCQKPYIIQGCFYATMNETRAHCYGHRVEATLNYLTANWKREDRINHADRFWGGYWNSRDGLCGNTHWPLGAGREYDYTNPAAQNFACNDWLNFPNYIGVRENVDCSNWGCSDTGWQAKWLGSIPRSDGEVTMTSTSGRSFQLKKNWWYYLLYPQNAIALRHQTIQPTPSPRTSLTPTVRPTVTPVPFPEDINRDGCLDIRDFSLWLLAFQTGRVLPQTYPDINNDGTIDILDFTPWFLAMRAGTNLCQ